MSRGLGAFHLVTVSLEGLAEVGEANANTSHQHFIPSLEFFTTWLGFNFKHNLEKTLQMPQKLWSGEDSRASRTLEHEQPLGSGYS